MIAQQACSHGWDDDGVRLSVVGILVTGLPPTHPPTPELPSILRCWSGKQEEVGGEGGHGPAAPIRKSTL